MITLAHTSLTCVQPFTSFLLFVSLNPAYFKLISSGFSTDAPYGLYTFSFPNHCLDPRWVSVLFLLSGCTYDVSYSSTILSTSVGHANVLHPLRANSNLTSFLKSPQCHISFCSLSINHLPEI